MTNFNSSRRNFLHGAAPAIAGAIAAGNLVTSATASAEPAALPATPPAASPSIWSHEYWAMKGNVKLYMFRKRLGAPKAGERKPVLFLAHGSSISGRPSFDLTVPGGGDYSFMDKFAGYGFDVWTMDFAGYGRSSQTDGNSNIQDGVEDLKAAVPVIVKETGQERLHFFGESSGALRVGAYAMVQPERVNRLVLASFTYTGKGSPTLIERAKQLDFYRTHNRRPRDRAMIESIFTRDRVGTADPAAAEALAKAELPLGDSVPTGTYLDMCANLPVVDPLKVKSPVLIVRGEFDGIATEEDLSDFYRKLPVADRQWVILPGLSHSVAMGINRHLVWYSVRQFLQTPTRKDIAAG